MEHMCTVSIILLPFTKINIRKMLKNIANQSYKNLEIIVVLHKNSKPEEFFLKNQYKFKIKYFIVTEDFNEVEIVNRALLLVSGKYVCLSSGCCVFRKKHLENLVNVLENSNNQCAYAINRYLNYEKNEKRGIGSTLIEFLKYFISIEFFLFRCDTYKQLGSFNVQLGSYAELELLIRYFLHLDMIPVYEFFMYKKKKFLFCNENENNNYLLFLICLKDYYITANVNSIGLLYQDIHDETKIKLIKILKKLIKIRRKNGRTQQ